MSRPRPRARLGSGFDRLEDRTVPTTFGVPWADPTSLTLSFVPDGTATPVGTSGLSATMAGAPGWQREVLRAYQAWAVHANLNIGLVADGGQPLGAAGAPQGDTRFGDVRVAAMPQGADTVGAASPFTWNATTYAGDLLFNTAEQYTVGNSATAYDVFSVALHEAGHSLGLDHSEDERSVLVEEYRYYTGLSSVDVAALQALYGPREKDAFDAAAANDHVNRPSALPKIQGHHFAANGDLTTRSDVDHYKLTFPSSTDGTGPEDLSVRLLAAGRSLLTARVSVLDSRGKVVRSAVTTDPLANDIQLRVVNAKPGAVYTIKVEQAADNEFAVGSYRLVADALATGAAPPAESIKTAGPVTDGHANDSLAAAKKIDLKNKATPDGRFDVTVHGVIEDATDTDYYKFTAPAATTTAPSSLNVMAWGLDPASPLSPRLRVYGSTGSPVAFQVVTNDTGVMSIRVPNATPGALYYVQVSARTAGVTGTYFLGADLNQTPAFAPAGVASNTLANNSATDTASLTLATGGVFQFNLAATLTSAGAARVTMDLIDAAGRTVLSLTADGGQPLVTRAQYLAAGAYTVRYQYQAVQGQTKASVRYDLFLSQLTEEAGVRQTRTSTSPPPPPPPPPYTYSGISIVSTSDPYYM